MKDLYSLTKYQVINVLRAKWLIAYALLFCGLCSGFLFLGDDINKAVASVLTVVLFIVPLISILYAAIYWYNSTAFIYLLLSHPLPRRTVFLSYWISISLCLAGGFLVGLGAALLAFATFSSGFVVILFAGVILTFIFVGLGLLTAVFISDPVKGVGGVFLLWLYFSILHDILVFAVASLLRDYPVEVPAILLMASNPIDLTRVYVLLELDLSAMMSYTGKILQQFLSGSAGAMIVVAVQLLWLALPIGSGIWIFSRRDLSM